MRSFRFFDKQRSPGLPQSTVMDMAQDSQGVLWLATLDGLASFDGTAIRTVARQPGAPAFGILYAVVARRDGGLWVGGASSVFRHDVMGSWAEIPAPGAAPALAEDGTGGLWRADQEGQLWRLDGDHWARVEAPVEPVLALTTGPGGLLWVAGHGRVARRLADDWSVVDAAAPAVISAFTVARDGTLWIGTAGGAVLHLHPDHEAAWQAVSLPGWQGGRIRDLAEDRRGRIWAGGYDIGVGFGTADGPWTIWGPENGLRREGVLAILADREGTVWLSANGYGLQQWVGEAWSHRNRWADEPEPRLQVFGISPTHDGRGFLAAVFDRGIWRWDGRTMEHLGADRGLDEDVRHAVEPRPGTLWVAARHGIYAARDGEPFRWATRVPSGFVQGFVRDLEGDWWAQTSAHGALRHTGRSVDDDAWEPASFNHHLVDLNVRALMFRRGAEGSEVWVGTLGGLHRFVDGALRTLPGEIHDAMPASVHALLDTGDHVWVAGFGGIVVIPADGNGIGQTAHLLGADEGLPGNTIYSLAQAADGSVWVGGSNGVGRVVRDADGSFRITVWDATSGLIEDECNHGGLYVAPDGTALVGTMASLARFDPDVRPVERPPLRVVWTKRPGADGEPLPADHRSVALAWRAPWLAPDTVEYATRVARLGDAWSRPSTRTTLDLENLGPGTWTVEVAARLAVTAQVSAGDARNPLVLGPEWTQPAVAVFHIEPLFRETITFWLLLAALAGLAVFGFVRWRTAHLRSRAEELERAVAEAVARIKVLGGLLPICASCKKVRDDAGYWRRIETYLHEHSEAELSHGLCPECTEDLYGEFFDSQAVPRTELEAAGQAPARDDDA